MASLIETVAPPLAAAKGDEVFAIARVSPTGRPLPYGDFYAKQDTAVDYAFANLTRYRRKNRRGQVW